MNDRNSPTREDLFETVLVPVANEEDACETARAVRAYLPPDARVYVAHVVEKGEGVPDKASVEQRHEVAAEVYQAFLDALGAERVVSPLTLYGRDVAATILDGARDVGASSIVYTPRGGGRVSRLLSGDVSSRLLQRSDVPVVALPRLRERIVLD